MPPKSEQPQIILLLIFAAAVLGLCLFAVWVLVFSPSQRASRAAAQLDAIAATRPNYSRAISELSRLHFTYLVTEGEPPLQREISVRIPPNRWDRLLDRIYTPIAIKHGGDPYILKLPEVGVLRFNPDEFDGGRNIVTSHSYNVTITTGTR
ncbi:MAG: hypothetical protein ACR2IE_03985 [Candidatus Sumerlaeaceae bacterium]